MADINVERKSGASWLWWIIGIIILALIIWWLVSAFDNDDDTAVVAVAPVATAPAVTEPMATEPMAPATTPGMPATGIAVAEILANPAAWAGKTVSGTVQVVDVPTDRGFWIESNGQRLFAVLNDQPQERPQNVNPGQTVQITSATVMTLAAGLPGDLDADTKALLQGQPAFLAVDESNIALVSAAPGATMPDDQ